MTTYFSYAQKRLIPSHELSEFYINSQTAPDAPIQRYKFGRHILPLQTNIRIAGLAGVILGAPCRHLRPKNPDQAEYDYFFLEKERPAPTPEKDVTSLHPPLRPLVSLSRAIVDPIHPGAILRSLHIITRPLGASREGVFTAGTHRDADIDVPHHKTMTVHFSAVPLAATRKAGLPDDTFTMRVGAFPHDDYEDYTERVLPQWYLGGKLDTSWHVMQPNVATVFDAAILHESSIPTPQQMKLIDRAGIAHLRTGAAAIVYNFK